VRELQDPHLPLARLTVDRASVYLASAGLAVGHEAPAVVHQTRRRDAEDWDWLSGPVNVSAGPQKDVMLRRSARLAHTYRWYAVGQRNEIRKTLKLLWGPEVQPHGQLGGARRSGSGQIVRWSIEQAEHLPEACFVGPGDVLRRHLPLHWLEQIESPRVGAVRPPYWHPGRRCHTAEVGSTAVLTLAVRTALSEVVC
jgi:hypothetical protein